MPPLTTSIMGQGDLAASQWSAQWSTFLSTLKPTTVTSPVASVGSAPVTSAGAGAGSLGQVQFEDGHEVQTTGQSANAPTVPLAFDPALARSAGLTDSEVQFVFRSISDSAGALQHNLLTDTPSAQYPQGVMRKEMIGGVWRLSLTQRAAEIALAHGQSPTVWWTEQWIADVAAGRAAKAAADAAAAAAAAAAAKPKPVIVPITPIPMQSTMQTSTVVVAAAVVVGILFMIR